MSGVAYLYLERYDQNTQGVYETSGTERMVYVKVESVTGREWFEGGRNGLNPQYRFTMFMGDYWGEKVIKYRGTKYTIYRIYNKSNDEVELYAELRKGSVNITEPQIENEQEG